MTGATGQKPRVAAATVDALLARVESARSLDPAIESINRFEERALPEGPIRAFLRGEPIGHPLHPALILVPAGAFISAVVLDLVPHQRAAVRALVATGIAASVPAAVAGASDWTELRPDQQRVGLAHAVVNAVGIACFASSLAAEARGRRGRARLLRVCGLGAISSGGFIGGHLSYRLAAGVEYRPARLQPESGLGARRGADGPVLG